MKILTWNINGIRGNKGLPLKQLLDSLDADIICLQETKVTRDQLDESTAVVEGYSSYFSFSRARSGYSGVATFARENLTPCKAEDGLSASGRLDQCKDQSIGQYDCAEFTDEELMALDREGRTVMTQHRIRDSTGVERDLVIINVYCPRAEIGNEDRKAFKMQFYRLLQARAEAILKSGSHVIVLGDINTSHRKIDHCDPAEDEEFYANPGRKWLDNFLCDPVAGATDDAPDEHHQFIDTFRLFHPHQLEAFTNWCSVTGARGTNYGCRLDYIFADKFLARHIFRECYVMPEVLGSDHCPVKAVLDCSAIPAKKCPSLCTKYMPQFAGKQQKLSMFLVKASKPLLSQLTDSALDCRPSGDCDNDVESSQEDGNFSRTGAGGSDLKVSNGTSQAVDGGELSRRETGLSSLSQSTFTDISLSGVGSFDADSLVTQQSLTIYPKRSLSESKKIVSKKLKVESKTVGKQSNLLNFFGKRDCLKTSNTESSVVLDHFGSISGDGKTVDADYTVLLQESDLNSLQSEKGGKTLELNPSYQSIDSGNIAEDVSELTNHSNNASTWKSLLKGPPPTPMCKGHDEPCVLRTVKKAGPNKGRQFFTCSRPEGHKTNREARCEYFVWVSTKK